MLLWNRVEQTKLKLDDQEITVEKALGETPTPVGKHTRQRVISEHDMHDGTIP